MAQLLHHQDSAFYGKEFQGCRWGILQFFGFRRRLRSTKMISETKHGQGKRSGRSRRRASYVSLKDEGSGVMDDDNKNTEVTDKHKGSKNTGKTSLKSLIVRKLYGKEGQKEKMLPVAPKLLRTLSIHYLERNEYVLDGESASNADGSLHSTTLSMQNATSTIFSTVDDCDIDASSSLLLKNAKWKSHRSISMDGMLHKVPYGQKVSGDKIREELPRSASATYDRDGLKPYIGTAAKRHANQGFRRSRSLSESLERYSHLLDSISSSEAKRVLTSSKSNRDNSLDGPGVTTALQKTSNSQFRSKGLIRHDEDLVIPEDGLAPHVPERSIVDGDVQVAMDERSCNEAANSSEKPVLLEEYMNDKKSDVKVSTEADLCNLPSEVVDISEEHSATCGDDEVPSSTELDLCTDPSTSEEVDNPEDHAVTCDDDQIHSSTEADSCTALHSEDIKIAEEHATIFDDDQIQSCISLPSVDMRVAEEHGTAPDDNQIQPFDVLKSIEGTCVPDPIQEIEAEFYLSSEQETESSTCVLDVAFSDDPASPVKHIMLDDSSLEPITLHVNDVDDSIGTDVLNACTSSECMHFFRIDDSIGTDVLNACTSSESLIQENVQENSFDDLDGLQVDQMNEDELNYVKDIFNKSSFRNGKLFDEWCSTNTRALQEEDCQHYEAAAAALDFTDMSADQLLLFDLTNEALLDIYKKYSVSKSKLSRFSSFDRPKPVGQHALKVLCSEVSYHLDEQPRSNVEIDAILSNDLARSNHWVNFQRDSDHLENKLADLVCDKLLAELTLELAEF